MAAHKSFHLLLPGAGAGAVGVGAGAAGAGAGADVFFNFASRFF